MNPDRAQFHLEEFKLVKNSAHIAVTRAENYFATCALSAAAVASWAALNSFGVGLKESFCLKQPAAILAIVWTLPTAIAIVGATKAYSTSLRVRQISAYLLRLETVLGISDLGFEKSKLRANGERVFLVDNKTAWIALVILCVASTGVGLYVILSYGDNCGRT
jgi:hypothetical protein